MKCLGPKNHHHVVFSLPFVFPFTLAYKSQISCSWIVIICFFLEFNFLCLMLIDTHEYNSFWNVWRLFVEESSFLIPLVFLFTLAYKSQISSSLIVIIWFFLKSNFLFCMHINTHEYNSFWNACPYFWKNQVFWVHELLPLRWRINLKSHLNSSS